MERHWTVEVVTENIRRLMAERELNAAELARKARTNPTGIYDILSGKSRSPRLDTVAKVAEALNVPLTVLLQPDMQPSSGNQSSDARRELEHIFQQLPPVERHRLLQAARAWLPGAETA